MDVAGHDADLALPGRDHAGAVGADEPGPRALERALDADHVEDRDALGDAHHEREPGVDRLEDGVGGEGRRHVDRRSRRAGGRHGLAHGVEDGQRRGLPVRERPPPGLPALPGGHAADHLRAVGDRLLRVEGALRAGEALADDLGVPVDEHGHGTQPLLASRRGGAGVEA